MNSKCVPGSLTPSYTGYIWKDPRSLFFEFCPKLRSFLFLQARQISLSLATTYYSIFPSSPLLLPPFLDGLLNSRLPLLNRFLLWSFPIWECPAPVLLLFSLIPVLLWMFYVAPGPYSHSILQGFSIFAKFHPSPLLSNNPLQVLVPLWRPHHVCPEDYVY